MKMNKRLLISVILFAFAFSLCCWAGQKEPFESSSNITGKWRVEYALDDFGDPTENQYMVNDAICFFSDEKTKDAEMDASIFYFPDNDTFTFRIMENDNQKITDEENASLKIKLDDEIYEYDLIEAGPEKDYGLSADLEPEGDFLIWNNLLSGTDLRSVI